ncbi:MULTISPECIES: GtrA family protein [Dyella]|uniref:GtrA family protein n=2 Tax=Dyella TaxID=231454 RepID=A0A4R0YPU5_9GAMM|nr:MULTISPECIES: GtrA family protein [Dyella]TBR36492.1 GtrA family protein [Dyella terrae]TCI08416.1 GtrA family protein [Dyella soli]
MRKLLKLRFIRFVLVGGLNTLFGFTVYALFVVAHSPTWVALIGGNLAGIVFNFLTTGHFVFLDVSRRRLPRFVAAYLLTYAMNLVLIAWLNKLTYNAIVSQAILTPFMAVVSYVLLSKLVFAPAHPQAQVEHAD